MSTAPALNAEARYRRFLLWVTAGLFLGIPVELLLTEHTSGLEQRIPFVLCAIGLVAVASVLRAPGRRTLLALRGAMIGVGTGALYGIYAHLSANVEFELEIRPVDGLGDVMWDALQGASPLLAPGILALAALLGVSATFWHPLLRSAR
ncbi:MAG: hypothetical protein Rubg2KO_11110 [Rubricoccaceae bacterium]